MDPQLFSQRSDDDDLSFLFDCTNDVQPGDGSGMRRCYVCCEVISETATACPQCGIDLTGNRREVLTQKREEVTQIIDEIEVSLAKGGQYEQRDIEAYANLGIRASRNLIGIGILLLPLLVGAIPLVTGAILQHVAIKARDKARDLGNMISQLDDEDARLRSIEYRHLNMIDHAIKKLGPS